ncbi:MAG TPA: thioester domain-containing protein, partial [Anaerolineales bacterium]|nr:thioester domain-containing protein [Anaerolineales bacterium]
MKRVIQRYQNLFWYILLFVGVLFFVPAASRAANDVELCFDSLGSGQNIIGNLPGSTNETFFAGVFNIRIDGTPTYGFCTDINNPIGTGTCYNPSQVGVTDPYVACVLEYYPPTSGLTNLEAAARQASVWHFSDGFELSTSDAVYSRYQEIVTDINNKYVSGQCSSVQTPTLELDPPTAVNFLIPDGNGG